MRVSSGSTDRYLYFVAVDATDLKTRETGLATFTVRRSRNGGASAVMTTPTINETDVTNMPGVYELLCDEDTTLDAGHDDEEMVFHITHSGMAPVDRVIDIYRPKGTEGQAVTMGSSGVTVSALTASVITAASIAADAITDAKVASDVTIASVTGAVGSVVGLTAATVHADLDDIQARLPVALSAGGNIKADVLSLGGVAQSLTDLKDFADDGYDPATNKVQGVALVDTVTTYTGNTPQTGDTYALASGASGFVAIKAVIDALVATIGAAGAGLTATAAAVWEVATRVLTAGTNIVLQKNTGVTGFTDLDAASVRTAVGLGTANLDTQLTSLVNLDASVSSRLPTADYMPQTGDSFARLGALGAGLTALASQASVTAMQGYIDTEVAAILAAVDTEIAAMKAVIDLLPNGGALTALGNLDATVSSRATPAQVNAEVFDVIWVDIHAQPGQETPDAATSHGLMASYLYKAWLNMFTQTANQYSLYNDDGTTVDQKAGFSSDGTTAHRENVVSGP